MRLIVRMTVYAPTKQDEIGKGLCFLPSGLINWQIDDALNQCSSKAAYPVEPISGLR